MYGDKILYIAPWIAFIAAILLSCLVAFLIGIPVLKLKGHYLAMATLGFGLIIEKIIRSSKYFGGADGISSVPGFEIFPGIKISGNMSERILNYYIAWIIVIIALIVLINIINSRVGRALRSLHGNEEASNAMGIDTAKYKLNVFIIAAVFASIAGVFLTHYNGSIGPGEAGVLKSIRYLVIVAVGGMANIWGVLIMGLILNFLSFRGVFGSYDDAVFGMILILVMIFAPNGFFRTVMLKKIADILHKKQGI
jgi:branched-chain amino acid transport system permease protein